VSFTPNEHWHWSSEHAILSTVNDFAGTMFDSSCNMHCIATVITLTLDSTTAQSFLFSARCNIYISCLCYDVSVRLSVTEVHWRIMANLAFKF